MNNAANEVNPYQASSLPATAIAPDIHQKDSALGVRVYLWLHAFAVIMAVAWAFCDTRGIDSPPILDLLSAVALPGMVFIMVSPFACVVLCVQALLGKPKRMLALLAEMPLWTVHVMAALPLVQ